MVMKLRINLAPGFVLFLLPATCCICTNFWPLLILLTRPLEQIISTHYAVVFFERQLSKDLPEQYKVYQPKWIDRNSACRYKKIAEVQSPNIQTAAFTRTYKVTTMISRWIKHSGISRRAVFTNKISKLDRLPRESGTWREVVVHSCVPLNIWLCETAQYENGW